MHILQHTGNFISEIEVTFFKESTLTEVFLF